MMNRIGSRLLACLAALAALYAGVAHGAVTATVDRASVSMGDSLRLTLSASDDEDFNDRSLAPLQSDFEILQRSTSSNTTIINGHMSHSRQMIVELTPRREGNLQIPALKFDRSTTAPLTVVVGAASDTHTDGQPVVFDAQVDRDSVYVQGEVILTLRVQQSVNLEERTLTPLKLDNAFVKPLEQHSYQRTIDGRPWLVDEVRYAIFPEHSGTLEIPAQVFSGRIDIGPRSLFDMGRTGQQLRRSTKPLSITVLAKPDSFGASDWLPARNLTLEESWSTAPDKLRVGESATRTIRIVGEGLQGAQLPPVMYMPTDGLKYYPDQPKITEHETRSGLEGQRDDAAAVVPTKAGSYVLPEIRIPWWDTQSNEVKFAVLPARTITVLAAEPGRGSPAEPTAAADNAVSGAPAAAPSAPAPAPASAPASANTPAPAALTQPVLWQAISAISTTGWIATVLFLWRRRPPALTPQPTAPDGPAEKQAFKQLLLACAGSNAQMARTALISWATALAPAEKIVSLGQVAAYFADRELSSQLDALDTALYRPDGGNWNGASLADCARRLRPQSTRKSTGPDGQLQLYPATSHGGA
jgi:hypothetical protein